MKVVALTCPSCGAQMNVAQGQTNIRCRFCGAQIYLDDEVQRVEQHIKYDNAEEAGYSFERGRQRAQYEAGQGLNYQQTMAPTGWQQPQPVAMPPKKKSIWKMLLWGLGWLCIFPVPLTILLLRKKDIPSKQRTTIIAVAWIAYLIFVAIANITNPQTEAENERTDVNDVAVVDIKDETDKPAEEEDIPSVPDESKQLEPIRLEGGILGEYGAVKVNNQGTDLEEERIVFNVPAGIYEVKCIPRQVEVNLIQVHIYSYEEIQDGDSPYHIPADQKNVDLDSGQTVQVEIPDGYYIWLNDGDIIELTKSGEETSNATEAPQPTVLLLEGGVMNEYASEKINNQGTDLEERRVIFDVPSGLYEVKGLSDPWSQVNVYSHEEIQQGEWLEPADSKSVLVKNGETASIEVPEGYYIYIAPPDKIELTKK